MIFLRVGLSLAIIASGKCIFVSTVDILTLILVQLTVLLRAPPIKRDGSGENRYGPLAYCRVASSS